MDNLSQENYELLRIHNEKLLMHIKTCVMMLFSNHVLETAKSLSSAEAIFFTELQKSELQFYDVIAAQDAQIATIKRPQMKKNAEEQLIKVIDNHYQTIQLITDEFHKNIENIIDKNQS
jgi:hypothetical protein